MVNVHLERELQFGADSIDARDQNRVSIFRGNGEEGAEAANLAENILVEGLVSEILDALLSAVGTLDIHTRVGISDRRADCRILGHGARLIFARPGHSSMLNGVENR